MDIDELKDIKIVIQLLLKNVKADGTLYPFDFQEREILCRIEKRLDSTIRKDEN